MVVDQSLNVSLDKTPPSTAWSLMDDDVCVEKARDIIENKASKELAF